MNVLSIQSEVVYGHVGNSAARFVLQRMGHEVWAIPTVLFSNHPGHNGMRGEAIPADRIRALIDGLDERGWLKSCDAVLSGYLGSPDQAEVVAEAVARVKAQNPNAIYYCDPVFGDDDGTYAKPGVAEAMARQLVPIADAIFPNRFELSQLTGAEVEDVPAAVDAARLLQPKLVIASSLVRKGPAPIIGTAAVAPDHAVMTSAPMIAEAPHGTGDILAATFLAHRLNGLSIAKALQLASSTVDHLIRASAIRMASEMPLIEEQSALANPPKLLGLIAL